MHNLIDDRTVDPYALVVGIAYGVESICVVTATLGTKSNFAPRALESASQFAWLFVISLRFIDNCKRRLSGQRKVCGDTCIARAERPSVNW